MNRQPKNPADFRREKLDLDFEGKVQCETPGCTDPDCLVRKQRNAYRFTLGTLVEAMQGLVVAQHNALALWGDCRDPHCTFEEELQVHLGEAGVHLGEAFTSLCHAVEMWKSLPEGWHDDELTAADVALASLETLAIRAAEQTKQRRSGRDN